MPSITRRLALKLMTIAGAAAPGATVVEARHQQPANPDGANATQISWTETHDRVWLHADCWSNPMEDWHVVDGTAECMSTALNRNIHLLTHQFTNSNGRLQMSVVLSQVEAGKRDSGAGFELGVRSELNEVRSNAFATGGIRAGIANGMLIVGAKSKSVQGLKKPDDLTLRLSGMPENGRYRLTLTAIDSQGEELGRLSSSMDGEALLGNVALVNNYGRGNRSRAGAGGRYRFNNWHVTGDAFTFTEANRFGPILWTMYTLSDSRSSEGFVLKLSALTGPLGKQDNHDVELYVQKNGAWASLGTAELDQQAWTATFRIPQWDASHNTPYRAVYREQSRNGDVTESVWEGTVKSNPSSRPLRLGALTCQKDYGFPYAPVADNLARLDPDMLYFAGDQLYEDHGGYGLIRDPADRAILNYLRKYYMHGWAFRHAMKNAPTVCIPDDHDVFQGNIWGEGGKPMKPSKRGASSNGGYREPAAMVNVVHTTCASHHPDYFDATPVQQGISVYFGDMVYGGVSFAILGDRQFKSGPEHVNTGGGRADHVGDPDFDTAKLDVDGLQLLGSRQEKFLRHWAQDWRGHSLKVLLSQTVFAGVATHHGTRDGYLKADLDSGAWPQTPRDNAIDILRPSKALHINGDQHLTTLCQYGVGSQRDSGWSFCVPAISAGYPRWWLPDEIGMPHENRPQHGLPNTGEFIDGFGNRVYVYAVGNPQVGKKKNRYERAHEKGSGFSLVTIDTESKTYHLESFRFMVDATDGNAANQFPGWPVTIHQQENSGENIIG